MMVYQRTEFYYVKRSFRGIGKVEKSLRTKDEGRADFLEGMLLKLHERGRLDLIRAWIEDRVTIERLADAYEEGRLHVLSDEIRTPDVSLEYAIERALAHKKPDVTERTHDGYTTGLSHFLRIVGRSTVREALTDETIQSFKRERLEEGMAEQTVNNNLQAVSILATFAEIKGWVESRPEIRRFPTKVRIRWMDASQIRLYMAHLPEQYRPLMELLIATGMRLGEAESLTAGDVREGSDRMEIQIREAKGESQRTVFVPPWAAETVRVLIEDRELQPNDGIFDHRRRTVQYAHSEAASDAGVGDHTIHDHRHTAAVHMAKAGMPLNLIQQQLGHKHIEQTMRYARFHPDYGDVEPHFQKMGRNLGLSGDTAGGTLSEQEKKEQT